jgi:acyl carrier protein
LATLSLKRLGLDSLMAMRLNNRVRAALGVEAPTSLYLAEQSLAALAAALCQRAAQTRDAAALVAQMEEGSL